MADHSKDHMNQLATANNILGLNIHGVLSENGGNVFFSPLSISIALAILFKGTKGISNKELKNVLGYDEAGIKEELVHLHFQKLLAVMSGKSDYTISIANALLQGFPIRSEYKEHVENFFEAMVSEVNFTDQKATIEIVNRWVQEKTNNMIPKMFETLNPDTVMMLINAVYFKGLWFHQFDHHRTMSSTFYNFGLDEGEVPMMFKKEHFYYLQNDKYSAVELPYIGEEVVMIIILPKEMQGLHSVVKGFVSKEYPIPKFYDKIKINLSLPKFRLEYSKEMRDVFKQLGLESLFCSSTADLSGLTDVQDIFVSSVFHKAVIDVSEQGTEAAAATVISLCKRSLEIIPQFIVDHPFLFFIVDRKCEAILFMGQIEEFLNPL